MAKQEQHLTIARLSAFIDGQLSPEEQAQSETHLHDCAVCQQQLTELRQTIALLHALPQLKLPRSFTLPTAEPAIAPHATPIARPFMPMTPRPRRNGWPTYVNGAVRVASTLAALLGIIFLLSGLFGTVIHLGGGVTTSGSGTTTSHAPSTTAPQNVPHVAGTAYERTTPTSTPTPAQSVSSPDKNEHKTTQQNPLHSFLTLFDVSMAGNRAILGVILLVLGIIGFIVVTRRL